MPQEVELKDLGLQPVVSQYRLKMIITSFPGHSYIWKEQGLGTGLGYTMKMLWILTMSWTVVWCAHVC